MSSFEDDLTEGPYPWNVLQEQKRLVDTYPLFFRAMRYPSAYPSNLAFLGIQCGPGWYPIIEEVAQQVEQELDVMWSKQVRNPWGLASMERDIRTNPDALTDVSVVIPYCSEISECKGRLKIRWVSGYLLDGSALIRIQKIIKAAEIRSGTVCVKCGGQGFFRNILWERVYCNNCIS